VWVLEIFGTRFCANFFCKMSARSILYRGGRADWQGRGPRQRFRMGDARQRARSTCAQAMGRGLGWQGGRKTSGGSEDQIRRFTGRSTQRIRQAIMHIVGAGHAQYDMCPTVVSGWIVRRCQALSCSPTTVFGAGPDSVWCSKVVRRLSDKLDPVRWVIGASPSARRARSSAHVTSTLAASGRTGQGYPRER
jgi:hypothetical protein